MAALAALSEALGLGPEPEAVLDPLFDLYAEVDGAVDAGAEGLDLPCRPGCDACCHESVFLSAPEFLAVAAELLGWSEAARRRVVDAMRALAVQFEDELELLETLAPGPERDEVAARVKFRCPLLSEAGLCTVYRARELNARTFGRTVDADRDTPYGCTLTHQRLRVLPLSATARLASARDARRRLVERLPGTARVHVYPWWFSRYGAFLG